MTVLVEKLMQVKKFLDAKEPDEAWDILDPLLREDINDPRVLIAAAEVQEKSRRITTAYQFAERAVHRAPNISGSWLMFGRMADLLYRFDEAEMAYRKSLEIAPDDARKATALMYLWGL
jgi:cytochrome c-type biogenesis protein CcmH/NrfG